MDASTSTRKLLFIVCKILRINDIKFIGLHTTLILFITYLRVIHEGRPFSVAELIKTITNLTSSILGSRIFYVDLISNKGNTFSVQ